LCADLLRKNLFLVTLDRYPSASIPDVIVMTIVFEPKLTRSSGSPPEWKNIWRTYGVWYGILNCQFFRFGTIADGSHLDLNSIRYFAATLRAR